MNLGLSGKRVIVTGASRGIGAAVAEAFAAEGASLALVARTEAAVTDLARRLPSSTAVTADLSRPDSLAAGMKIAVEALGGVDVLINNAGTSPFGSFDAITDAEWQAAFDLKVMGYVRCIRKVLPAMRAQGSGTIVNIVGMAGRHATPGYVLGACNAALLHLTRSLAELVARDGIRVSAINPGLTATDRMRSAMEVWAREANQDVEGYTRDYLGGLPLKRFAQPEEIARLVVLLSSDVMALTTGSALQADGASARGHL